MNFLWAMNLTVCVYFRYKRSFKTSPPIVVKWFFRTHLSSRNMVVFPKEKTLFPQGTHPSNFPSNKSEHGCICPRENHFLGEYPCSLKNMNTL
jgi:hypothetical protein